MYIKNILSSSELDFSTTEEFSVVKKESSCSVTRKIKFYNLDMIISVGYKVNSKRNYYRFINEYFGDRIIKNKKMIKNVKSVFYHFLLKNVHFDERNFKKFKK